MKELFLGIEKKKILLIFIKTTIISSISSLATKNESIVYLPTGINTPEGEISVANFAVKLVIIVTLVLFGGLLAGLTLGLMSLSETNLQILITSGTELQREWALRILPIRKNGHLLLVTMMLANTLTNMALPILIDGIFGGGVTAVVISTVLILIFGEIIPQAVCARHGLRIGATFAWPVQILIWIMSPVAYPFAKILDNILGANHGMIYRRAELKELVAIHGDDHGGSLSHDEVTIIRGALDLSEKIASQAMTHRRHVFMVEISSEMDWVTMRDIQRAGHSRIPVYQGDRNNVIGLILTKSLLLLNPDIPTPVSKMKLYNIPRVSPDVTLVNLLNIFQEGASHMALVAQQFGDYSEVLGIVTLEDVIEELIQEEIIDETDVYIDVENRTKAIRASSGQIQPLKFVSLTPKSRADSELDPVTRARKALRQLGEEGPRSRVFASPKPLINYHYSLDDPSEDLHRTHSMDPVHRHCRRPGTEEDAENEVEAYSRLTSYHNTSPEKSEETILTGSY